MRAEKLSAATNFSPNKMTNPYPSLVAQYAQLLHAGKEATLGGFAPCPRPSRDGDFPRALIFSPHPDDECIIGALPLRLLREGRFRVMNVAVTQGSKKERQAERLAELMEACRFIGYDLIQTAPNGLEKINPKARQFEPGHWAECVASIIRILRDNSPRVIFFPHANDWNSTHIGTHHLVMDALTALGPKFETYAIETEYWGQNNSPNLMVESTPEQVADLVAGTSFHVGEVRRNPFHLFLPAWMQDNVRRGSELVGGQGEAAPDFTFATLYRLRLWKNGALHEIPNVAKTLPKDAPISTILP